MLRPAVANCLVFIFLLWHALVASAFLLLLPKPPETVMRRYFVAAICLIAASNPVSAQAPQGESSASAPAPAVEPSNAPQPMEEPQVGDIWTYELRDDI